MPVGDYLYAPVVHLGALIAASSTFQSTVGAANAAAALAFIHRWHAATNWSGSRAIIGRDEGAAITKTGTQAWHCNARLFALFEFDEEANRADEQAAGNHFAQTVEAILDDMLPLCGADVSGVQYLDVVEFQEEVGPTPGDPDLNQGVYYWWSVWKITFRG